MFTLPILQIVTFSLALWLGMYLLGRHFQKPGMRFAGLGLVAYALGLALDMVMASAVSPEQEALLRQERAIVAILPAVFWFASVRDLFPARARAGLPRLPLRIVMVGSIFFAMSVGMVVLPQQIFTSDLVMLAVGLDLIVLSIGIAGLDAYDEGESLRWDALRSFGASMLAALVFGGQVVLAISITGQNSAIMLFLLLAIISTSIIVQTFSDPIQELLDRLLLTGRPHLQSERARLRAAASALQRADDSLDIASLPDVEFNRLTRRALSHMGDLRRLASNPLTRLPVIAERLAARGQPESILERAAELKALLAESIETLKPRNSGGSGITDEWHYYNALYYPYVLGVKPYSRTDLFGDDGNLKAVLEWFRVQVPERTLHNWQNTAAELIALHLREQSKSR